MRTFEDTWSISGNIYGSLTRNEGHALYTHATEVPANGFVVEVGSYCGRSSSILAQLQEDIGYKLMFVDNFITQAPNVENVHEEFIKNVPFGSYTLVVDDSSIARSEADASPQFLFIDGDHEYWGVKRDIHFWVKDMVKGSIVAFHDYNSSWDGVRRAVDEHNHLYKHIHTIDSMYIAEIL